MVTGFKVFVSPQWAIDAKNRSKVFEQEGITVHRRMVNRNSPLRRVLNKFWERQYSGPCRELISFKPDVVVINSNSGSFLGDYCLLETIDQTGVPFVIMVHSSSGFFSDEQRKAARKYYKKAHAVCFTSIYSRQMIERHLAMPLANSKVVRHPPNITRKVSLPLSYPAFSGTLEIAAVSRLNCFTKGQDYLLQALAHKDIKNLPFVCRIYGDGLHHHYIKELVKYYGLAEKVKLMGHTNDIVSVWFRSHLHVLPSITESGPIVLTEAMLCGRPSLATRVGGVSEWMDDGVHGYLIENANNWNFVPGFQNVFENIELLPSLGSNAFTRAKELIGDPASDYLEIIKRAI